MLRDSVVYKTIGQVELRLHIFRKPSRAGTEPSPVVLFFTGGGHVTTNPKGFFPQCHCLAKWGYVAISGEYRVLRPHGASPFESIADAKSAVRWIRGHAEELGIDPDKIAVGGQSAGGHIAACAGILDEFDEPDEDASISSRPDALVLFDPGLDMPALLVVGDGTYPLSHEEKVRISPARHFRTGLPPTILFHGTADAAVAFSSSAEFCKQMVAAGNTCELVPFEDKGHACCHFGMHDSVPFRESMIGTLRFLSQLEFVDTIPEKVDMDLQELFDLQLQQGMIAEMRRDLESVISDSGIPPAMRQNAQHFLSWLPEA